MARSDAPLAADGIVEALGGEVVEDAANLPKLALVEVVVDSEGEGCKIEGSDIEWSRK